MPRAFGLYSCCPSHWRVITSEFLTWLSFVDNSFKPSAKLNNLALACIISLKLEFYSRLYVDCGLVAWQWLGGQRQVALHALLNQTLLSDLTMSNFAARRALSIYLNRWGVLGALNLHGLLRPWASVASQLGSIADRSFPRTLLVAYRGLFKEVGDRTASQPPTGEHREHALPAMQMIGALSSLVSSWTSDNCAVEAG